MIKTVTAEDLITMNPKPYGLVDDPYNQTRITGPIQRADDGDVLIGTQLGTIRLPQGEYVGIAERPEDMASSEEIKNEDENGFFHNAEVLGRFHQQNIAPPAPSIHRDQLPDGNRTLSYGRDRDGTEMHVYA